jgi:copper chaperone CopZ
MIIKKTYELEDLDCANCAAKMEERIKKIDGVASASVSFIMQNLTIEADESDLDKIMKQVVKICRKVEPDCRIIL